MNVTKDTVCRYDLSFISTPRGYRFLLERVEERPKEVYTAFVVYISRKPTRDPYYPPAPDEIVNNAVWVEYHDKAMMQREQAYSQRLVMMTQPMNAACIIEILFEMIQANFKRKRENGDQEWYRWGWPFSREWPAMTRTDDEDQVFTRAFARKVCDTIGQLRRLQAAK